MARKKNRNRHESELSDEAELLFQNLHMRWCDFVHYNLIAANKALRETTAPASLYLSNATNEPIGNNEPAEPLSAQPDPAQLSEPAEPDHPAAMVRPDLMNTATVHGPGAAVADHAEIRTDPVPAPTVLIVRKGTRPHKHIEQPQQPARPFPVSMAMLQKNVTTAFVQIER